MKRLLTGDRPTGRLHLGHYVGSIHNRLKLQDDYECYFIIADLHTLTTKPDKAMIKVMQENIIQMVVDYLAVGIKPLKSCIFLQSEIRAIHELNSIFQMLVTLPRLRRIPSVKEMAKAVELEEDEVSFGLMGYPVLQSADILSVMADVVPVGHDNAAHLEITREIARRFNFLYGKTFKEPETILSSCSSLRGTDGFNKMSKSLSNAIYLSDDAKTVEKKIRSCYTDPNRIHGNEPGNVEGNPVFDYHDAFNPDKDEVEDLKNKYRLGTVSDREVKEKCAKAINTFLDPIRAKRENVVKDIAHAYVALEIGTERTNKVADANLVAIKKAMGLGYAYLSNT